MKRNTSFLASEIINFCWRRNSLLIVSLLLLLSSCRKDKLSGELDLFKGKYTWKYTEYSEYWWSSDLLIRDASVSEYTAEIEFDDRGKVIFYIDGQKVHKTGYSVERQETIGNTVSLRIQPFKENSKHLDLNDFMDFTVTNDTLTVDDFPSESYDDSFVGTHFFIRN